MQAAGRVAAVLLRADAMKDLSNLPELIAAEGRSYPVQLVVFLDRAEYETKLSKGLVALLDDMAARGRDLIRFTVDQRLS